MVMMDIHNKNLHTIVVDSNTYKNLMIQAIWKGKVKMTRYIVETAYTDNTADIIDLKTLERKFFTEKELIHFAFHNEVLGVVTNGHRLIKLDAYKIITFCSYNEAYEYAMCNGISESDIQSNGDYCYIFEYNPKVVEVVYVVIHWTMYEQTYVGPKNSYTKYETSAKRFTKEDAGKKAAMMNRKRGTTWWRIKRILESDFHKSVYIQSNSTEFIY